MKTIFCAIAGCALLSVSAVADEISFATEIRPILSDKCFKCHGPDENKREAGLRLDDEASVKQMLESGSTAVVPGNLEASTLIQRIHSTDPDLRMPPHDADKQLTAAEIELLTKWVQAGASWELHWAFDTVRRPALPAPADGQVVHNDIDRFIQARLSTAGLRQNAEADRITLIRRVTFDLTGLPPTVEEVDAFLKDASPNAYEAVVDRLLKSPRFGEHMARFWLDAARYGDTHGLHLDNYREMWAYRDWVINAFNNNLSFRQFTIEQLAGDLLPNATDDQVIASGFNRCHVTTSEGGSISEEVEMRNTVERVLGTGTVFMGLTLDCSRCHNHKFDPITVKDFYSLYGYFNSIDGGPLDGNRKDHAPVIKVLTSEQKQQVAALQQQVQQLRQEIRTLVTSVKYMEPEIPTEPMLSEPTEFVWIDDALPAGANAQGNTPWSFVKAPAPVFSGETSHTRTATGLSQHFFEAAKQPLRIGEGDVLFCYVYLDPKNPPKEIMLQWNDGTWNHRSYWGGNLIEWGDENSPSRLRRGDLPATGEWVRLEVPASEVGLAAGTEVTGWAFTQFDGTVHWDKAGIVSRASQQPVYDSFALWLRDQQKAGGTTLPESTRVLVTKPADQRGAEEQQALLEYFVEHAYTETRGPIADLAARIASAEQQVQGIRDSAATTLVYRELSTPKPSFVLNRGEYDQPREQVERGVPAVLPPLPEGAPNNRLGLALWLTDRSHPLTSRVTVNRFWQQMFGVGLVKTSEDFGSQGEPPSHPLLLDWLSAEFMEPQLPGANHPWDVRHLLRLMVTSASYRQSSLVTPLALERDPNNRLLSRGPRFRLDAEMLRDQALAVSGLLVDRIGGPSVKPPQPDGLWFAVGYSGSNTVRFKKDDGHEKVHRRTLYTFIKRTSPPPQMSTFDAPSRESCTVRRERTNSPMQALLMMNDPQYVECARALAEKTMQQSTLSTDEERVSWMMRQVVLRHPRPDETAGLLDDYAAYLQEFQQQPDEAARLVAIGEVPPHADLSKEQLASWTLVANSLLNLDEVINK
ncbi:MAG: PSD1 domain-containing protein [Planctomycetaceae bacterium]|nr:PSD1 domain-containing protein [Planctomycetaceae bacterium]